MSTGWDCAVVKWPQPDGDLTALLNPLFLVQNPRNHSQQAQCSGRQLPWRAGFQFCLHKSSARGWCEENHPRRCVRTQRVVWVLALTEPLLFTRNTKAKKVTSASYLFRVDYISLQCQILGSASEAKCVPERKGPPQYLFWGCHCRHGVHTGARLGGKTQQLFPLCSQPRAARVADKTGYKLTPAGAQVEKDFLTAQGDASSLQKLHEVRNSLE